MHFTLPLPFSLLYHPLWAAIEIETPYQEIKPTTKSLFLLVWKTSIHSDYYFLLSYITFNMQVCYPHSQPQL